MSKKIKLIAKLRNKSIKAEELRTLLNMLDWHLERTKGSHEIWVRDTETFILATHSKDLKPYQLKQASETLLKEGTDGEKKD